MDLISAIKEIIASNGKSIVESDTFVSFLYDYNAFSEESHRAVPKIFKILCHDSKVQKIITEDKSGEILSFKIKTIISDITDEYGFEKDKVSDALKKLLIGCGVISDAEEWDVILSEPQLIEEQEEENLQVMPPLDNKSDRDQVTSGLAEAVQKYNVPEWFRKGLAKVSKVCRGYINKNVVAFIPCTYDNARDFSEGLAAVQRGDYWGFINKKGNEVIHCRYDEVNDFSEGLAAVQRGDYWRFINKSGEEVISCEYDEVNDFSEGLAWAYYYEGHFINKRGESILYGRDISLYDYAKSFSEGLVAVRNSISGWGFMNKTGEEVIPCMYDDAESFLEGLAKVQKGGKWGFINKKGMGVIPCRYKNAGSFSEGLAAVQKGRSWGFINKKGMEVIPCRYKNAGSFAEGLAAVQKGSMWGFIDKNEVEVIPCKYDDAKSFSSGLAAVKIAGKWGYVVKNGKRTFGNQ